MPAILPQLTAWQPASRLGVYVKRYLPAGVVLSVITAAALSGGAFEHVWDCCTLLVK